MTSTTDATLDVARGTLVLATVSEDYHEWPGITPGDRTFYATASDIDPDTYVTVIVPETDDRHRGMWATTPERFGLELDGQHYGWNVPRDMVRPYAATPADTTPTTYAVGDRVEVHGWAGGEWDGPATVTEVGNPYVSVRPDGGAYAGVTGAFPRDYIRPLTTRPRPASADLSESDRRALPISEAYPVGSVWRHLSYADPVTIVTHPTPDTVRITGPGVADTDNRDWPRGALDAYGTFVGWADDAPAPADESTTPETFTREDVDKAVHDALEDFKREANRIAVQYAEDNGLCSQFERAMDDIGLLGREEWHDANDDTYRVTFTVDVLVTARDESNAQDKAYDDLYEGLESPMDTTIRHHATRVED